MEKRRPSLEEVFSPRSVAVVGASPAVPRSFVNSVVKCLQESGFPAIYPVNRSCSEAFGLKCYPSVNAIPEAVDHVVVGIPAEAVLSLLDDCAAKGVKSVHFFTAGFSETGEKERAKLEQQMLEKARAGGFRIIGPNCIGLFVPKNRLMMVNDVPLEPGPIGFISQSGGHSHGLPFVAAPRGLRFSKVVSYGNALDVDESELLQYFAEDPETEFIGAYIEGAKDGKRFSNALQEASRRKPVIIFKGGMTDAGRRATLGHTASLTTSVAVFDALCRQMNAIRVDDIDELIDTLVALRFVKPLPRGTGIAIIGTGGGPSVLAADQMERAGLGLPRLSAEVQAELKRFLPFAGGIFGNPVDATNLVSPPAISATMRTLGKLPDVDILLYHLGFHPASRFGRAGVYGADFVSSLVNSLTEVRQAIGKPILMVLCSPPDLPGMKDFLVVQEALARAGFPVFHSFARTAKAIARVVAWKQRAAQ